jgi:methyl-accepting chemotaxis protein
VTIVTAARSIDKTLFAAFGTLVALALAVDALGLWATSALNERVDQLARVSGRALQLAGDIRYTIADIKARERLIVIAAAKQDLPLMTSEAARIDTDAQRLDANAREIEQTTHDPQVAASVRAISAQMSSWASQWSKTNKFAIALQPLDASDSSEVGRRYTDKADELATNIQGVVSARFAEDRESAAKVYNLMRGVLVLVVLVVVTVGAVLGYIVRRINGTLKESTSKLRHGSEQVLAAAARVAMSAQNLSRGVSQAAASLEETSASTEEMSSMTKENAGHSQEAAGLMREAETAVSGANHTLSEMDTAMADIKESSRKVSNIIKTIDEIAFQTNILALNAAVEAARAGEAGMGFAVVADEVRNLAQRSAQAARDTTILIEESIARSERGAAGVEKVGDSIRAITDSVTRVKMLIDQVSEASRQQAQGFHQVSQALGQIEQTTQANASNAEESAAAGEELNAQAKAALATVDQLEAMVGLNEGGRVGTIPGGAAVSDGAQLEPWDQGSTFQTSVRRRAS